MSRLIHTNEEHELLNDLALKKISINFHVPVEMNFID
jgi:hypothetical protein